MLLLSLSKVPIGIVQSGDNDAAFLTLHFFPILTFLLYSFLYHLFLQITQFRHLKKYVITILNPVFFTKETLPIKCFLMKLGELMLISLLDTQSQKQE